MAVSCRQRVILMAWRATGEVQAADVRGLEGAGLGRPCPVVAGGAAGRDLPPGQRLDPGMQQRLVALHDGDVMGFLLRWPASPGSPAPCGGRRRSPRHRPGPAVPGVR